MILVELDKYKNLTVGHWHIFTLTALHGLFHYPLQRSNENYVTGIKMEAGIIIEDGKRAKIVRGDEKEMA